MRGLCWSLLLLLAAPLSASAAAPAAHPAAPTFERDVRPILKVHCFHCHGEGDEREGGLDVRLRRLLLSGGDSGPAIEPGKPTQSLLYQRLRDGEMPPGDKRLPAKELAVIERWLAAGAVTARPEPQEFKPELAFTEEERSHWSLQPVVRPPVPAVRNQKLVRTPIDAFVLAKLEAEKLSFSHEANRRVLLRRVFYDLLGLPPTPAEVDAFMADKAPDAYEKLIDKLLARPEYGERWGRHWLDIAGYADSNGYSSPDLVRDYAFKYRDYVIRSFNADKPLDEFIREQLAGDELLAGRTTNLKPEELDKLIATGFLRMAPDGTGGPVDDPSAARNAVVADTIKIVSSSLLGLTVGCAECHDHKYDPISQADYYRMRAIFEPALDWKAWKAPNARLVSLMTEAERKQAAEIEAEAKKIEAERAKFQQAAIARTFEEQVLMLPKELQAEARAANATPDAKRTPAQKKLLKDNPSLNVTSGSLYLYDSVLETKVREKKLKRDARFVELIKQAADKAIAAAPEPKRDALRKALATAATSRKPEQLALLKEYPAVGVTGSTLAKFDPPAAKEVAALDAEIQKAGDAIATRTITKMAADAAAVRAKKPKEDFVHALTETPGSLPKTFVFHRGQFTQPKQEVQPGEPLVMASWRPVEIAAKNAKLPTSGRRLALAEHLTDGKHPLVGRVLVNRIWLLHFGRGLVPTPSDFGKLGQPPSHPELLDWLADDLVAGGWRLKRLHKLILTSTVYRQSSARRAELEQSDPDNHLLARMNVRRAEAEVIRDSILAVCGKLNAKQFGPPVPVMPDEVGQIVLGVDTRDAAGRPSKKSTSIGEEAFRRSVYVQVRRSMPLSMLEMFDAPTMTTTCNCEARSNSTVAPQSLILMNSQFLVDQAGAFAERLRRDAPDTRPQIELAWKLAFGRPPVAVERQAALAFLDKQTANFLAAKNPTKPSAAPTKATLKSASLAKPTAEALADAQRKALANLCQALLSSNEFLYLD
jgi:hypothetical protein